MAKKNVFNKLAGKGPKGSRDPEQEAARQLEATRRETAERLGGSRIDPSGAPPPMAPPAAPQAPPQAPAQRSPSPPPQAAPPSPPGGFPGAGTPPGPPAGGQTFGTPPSVGGAMTPTDERRAITDMALEDLQRQREATASESPAIVRPPRMPEDEFERRRPPAPGESLPGVPPPHIPSEDLRDQALREILERKERLDREYRKRQAQSSGGTVSSGPKTKLHGLAKKKKQRTLGKPSLSAAPAPAPAPEPEPEPEPRPEPSSTTTTGESVEGALAGIKGVGPVIRNALLQRFDSVEAIKEADPEELTEVDGIGPALASRIKTSL